MRDRFCLIYSLGEAHSLLYLYSDALQDGWNQEKYIMHESIEVKRVEIQTGQANGSGLVYPTPNNLSSLPNSGHRD